jgi:hypothetical protein
VAATDEASLLLGWLAVGVSLLLQDQVAGKQLVTGGNIVNNFVDSPGLHLLKLGDDRINPVVRVGAKERLLECGRILIIFAVSFLADASDP